MFLKNNMFKNFNMNDFLDKILVFLFSFSIAWFVILSAYFRKGVKIAFLVSFILAVMLYIRENKGRISSFFTQYLNFDYIFFIFFIFSAFISTIFSKDFKHSFEVFTERYIYYFIVFEIGRSFVVSKVVSQVINKSLGINVFDFLKYVFIIAGLLMGLGGVVDYLRFHPVRLFSVFGHEIQFLMLPLYIIYLLPVVYCFMFDDSALKQKIFTILTFILLFICMVFTGTRAAWISGIVSILFVSLLINKKLFKYFFLCFIIFLSFVYLFMPNRITDCGSYFIRKDIMQAALNIFKDNVFFGAGPGLYEILVGKYTTYSKENNIFLHAHNTYLEVLAELGFFGFLAFISIFINFYTRVISNFLKLKNSLNKSLYIGLLASNFGSLVFAFFGSIILVGFHDAPLFWLIFGLIFGFYQRLKNKNILNEFK